MRTLKQENHADKEFVVGSLKVLKNVEGAGFKKIKEDIDTLDRTVNNFVRDQKDYWSEISADGYINPIEKQILYKEWQVINTTYTNIMSQVEKEEVKNEEEIQSYIIEYNRLSNYLFEEIKLFDNFNESTKLINREYFNQKYTDYYDSEIYVQTVLINKLAGKTGQIRVLTSLNVTGLKNEVAIYLGQLYQWNGSAWKLTGGTLPTDPILHYSFDENENIYVDVGINSFNNDRPNDTTVSMDKNNFNIEFTNSAIISQFAVSFSNVYTGSIISFEIEGSANIQYINCIIFKDGSYINDGTFYKTDKKIYYKTNSINKAVIFQIFSGKKGDFCKIKNMQVVFANNNLPVIDNAQGKYNAINNGGIFFDKKLHLYKNNYLTNTDYKTSTNFTVSLWCRAENKTGGLIQNIVTNDSFIIRNGASWGTYLMAYVLCKNSDGTTNSDLIHLGSLLSDTEFEHIVVKKQGATVSCYRNGVYIAGKTYETEILTPSSTLIIASQYNSRGQDLDDIQFYNRALSDQEILGLYLAKGNTPKRFTLNDYRLNLIDDDGVISVSEKKELLSRWKEIYNAENVSTSLPTSNITSNGEYKAVIDAANLLNIGSISVITSYIESANALRNAFWNSSNGYLNNMTIASTLLGNLDSLFANYRQALQNANNAISDQQSAQASGITVQMASPFIQLPVNVSGDVISYENTGNIITVLNGAQVLTPVESSVTLADNQYSVTSSGSGITAGSVSVDATNKRIVINDSTALTKLIAQITYTIKFKINGTTGTLYAQQKISISSRGADGKPGQRGGMYLGIFTSTNQVTNYVKEDYFLNTTDGYCYYYDGSKWVKITSYSDNRYKSAVNDMISLGSNPNFADQFYAVVNAWINNLAAGNILADNILSKNLTITGSIKTEVYSDDEDNPKGAMLDSYGNIKINGQLNTPILKVKREKIEKLIKTFNPSNYQDAFESRNLIYYFKRFMAGTNDTNVPKYLKIICGGQIVKKIEMSLNSLHTISFIGENGVELDRVYIYNGRAVADINKYLTKTIQVYKYINDDYVLSLQNLETSGEFENIVYNSNGLIQLGGNHPLKKLVFPIGTKKSFIAAQIMSCVLFEDVKKYTEFWRPCMGYYNKWEILSLRIKENSVGLQNKINTQEWTMNIDDDSTIDSEIVLLILS